ncbi:MAG: threonyl-tRNA synthetase editing domain-containing protein [Bacteroidales bacterium]|jgi:threonyl-tRNA synthetase|nr:threonyl-tRNA synthetase editing domain-containing protein [Bacteroidales bacterium]
MRLLFNHCDYIKWEAETKSKFSLAEQINTKEGFVEETLVVFIAVEGVDQSNPKSVVNKTVKSIEDVSNRIKAKSVVIFPYVHLFPESLPPYDFALNCFKEISMNLEQKNIKTYSVPFGWNKMMEFKCKSHPLATLSKTVRWNQS